MTCFIPIGTCYLLDSTNFWGCADPRFLEILFFRGLVFRKMLEKRGNRVIFPIIRYPRLGRYTKCIDSNPPDSYQTYWRICLGANMWFFWKSRKTCTVWRHFWSTKKVPTILWSQTYPNANGITTRRKTKKRRGLFQLFATYPNFPPICLIFRKPTHQET